MTIVDVLLPLFVEVALTFVLGVWAFSLRVSAIRSGQARAKEVKLREPNWPPRVQQVTNAYQNQLELPLLFYLLTILAWITRHADLLFVLLAWVFVVLRLLHAYVHVTGNDLRQRGSLFFAGAIVLAVMWAIFMLRIVLGLP